MKFAQLIAFTQKEFRHIWRDKRSLLILIGMPIIQIMLFGNAITTEIKSAKIAILDHSKDPHTRKITHQILSSGYFLLDKNLESEKEIEEEFKRGKIKMAIIFESDFGKNLEKNGKANLRLVADASEPNTATSLLSYASAIIGDYSQSLNQNQMQIGVQSTTKMYYNPELEGVFYFIPGLIAVILMLISTMMTSIAITKEKELGTMEVLLVSPIHPAQIILSKVIPYFFLSLLNAGVIILLGKFVFGMNVAGSTVLLMLESSLFIILALSLGILISTATNSQQTALMISLMALMLPTILLSGFIFPIDNMPLPLRIISNIIPAKWFTIIVKSIMLKGLGIKYLVKENLILVGMTLFFLGFSIKKFKIRLE